LSFWIASTFVLGAVALVVDRTTGDETGPPYDDPLINPYLAASGIWALLDAQLAGGLLYFPNNETDALLHFGTSTIFLAGAAHYFLIEARAARRRPRRPETNQPGG
jgi:hypothetical protein